MERKNKNKKEKKEVKTKLQDKNIVLLIGLIYLLITILAVISYISSVNRLSTTNVTIYSVFGAIWWQILMIVLFIGTYILYSKKSKYGAFLELIMGIAMITNIIVSIVSMGVSILAIILELIFPTILIVHGYVALKKTKRKDVKKKAI